MFLALTESHDCFGGRDDASTIAGPEAAEAMRRAGERYVTGLSLGSWLVANDRDVPICSFATAASTALICVVSALLRATHIFDRVHLESFALIVRDYDNAIRFFVEALGFHLVEDSPAMNNDGRPKRWVVVRPPGAQTGLLLARADGEDQAGALGEQFAGRVGLFLRVDDFDSARQRMLDHGVEFVTEPRDEPYGRFAAFRDLEGNRWDLLGPPMG
jgi:catechol 2,3-dioxygenase-like lactoylglutathione lyase family enzyme